jgi:hypothetical protein
VAMHVPPIVSRDPALARLRHLAPFDLESPVMVDPAQVERFTALMTRHRVIAVLAGHTHFPDHTLRDGVHYIVAGAGGGLTPGFGIPNEYVDITVNGRELSFERVRLAPPAGDPLRFFARAFIFYADLNRFNHEQQGWNYVPSASVAIHTALRRTQRGEEANVGWSGAVEFERNLAAAGRRSLFAELGMTAATRDLAAHVVTGHRVRLVGSFNRGVHLDGAVSAHAGVLDRRAAAGVGMRLGAGITRNNVAFHVSHGRATDHRATMIGIGHRF